MVRLSRLWVGMLGLLVMMLLAAPASAQTGGLRGKVTDAAGKPVEGATVLIESKGVTRKLTVKTNKKGEFIQIGLYPGEYKVSAEKEGKVAVADNFRVGLGDPSVLDLQLSAGAANNAAEQQKKMAELQASFDAGVAATKAQNWDEAVAAFEKAAATAPNCHDCYYNIGYAYFQKKDYPNAEIAYKKATELKPDYAEAWNALANVYNLQKKLDEALAASNKAAELSQGGRRRRRRGGRGRRRQRRSPLQPGRDSLEPAEVRRGQGQVRGGHQDRPEARRGTIPARDVVCKSGRHAEGRGRVRELPRRRAERVAR